MPPAVPVNNTEPGETLRLEGVHVVPPPEPDPEPEPEPEPDPEPEPEPEPKQKLPKHKPEPEPEPESEVTVKDTLTVFVTSPELMLMLPVCAPADRPVEFNVTFRTPVALLMPIQESDVWGVKSIELLQEFLTLTEEVAVLPLIAVAEMLVGDTYTPVHGIGMTFIFIVPHDPPAVLVLTPSLRWPSTLPSRQIFRLKLGRPCESCKGVHVILAYSGILLTCRAGCNSE